MFKEERGDPPERVLKRVTGPCGPVTHRSENPLPCYVIASRGPTTKFPSPNSTAMALLLPMQSLSAYT